MYCGKWEAKSTMHDHQSIANGGYVFDYVCGAYTCDTHKLIKGHCQ